MNSHSLSFMHMISFAYKGGDKVNLDLYAILYTLSKLLEKEMYEEAKELIDELMEIIESKRA